MREAFNSGARKESLCVLLLEDDDADAYLSKRALMSIPCVSQVVRAKNGEEAVALLQAETIYPDIGFVDLQMPAMGGLDFLATCTDMRIANIPFIVLTSSSAKNDALRSRVQGALRVITKPENPSDLQHALEEAIYAFVPGLVRERDDAHDAPLRAPQGPTASPSSPVGAAAPAFGRRMPPRGA